MLKRLIPILVCALALVAPAVSARAGQASQPQTPQPAKARQEMVRLFLDCGMCDDDYLKKEVTFVDYVRNREDADVHLLVTIQETGGGGAQWTLKFIGLR